MITLRAGNERGHTTPRWLDSAHTFSFDDHDDPRYTGFRQLRVINDDWVKPGAGFGMHAYRDMEILTYVLEGAGRFGFDARPARARQMVLFANDSDAVALAAPRGTQEPLSALLIARVPLHEPVARYGLFVMNTEAGIRQALLDYQSGLMGAVTV